MNSQTDYMIGYNAGERIAMRNIRKAQDRALGVGFIIGSVFTMVATLALLGIFR